MTVTILIHDMPTRPDLTIYQIASKFFRSTGAVEGSMIYCPVTRGDYKETKGVSVSILVYDMLSQPIQHIYEIKLNHFIRYLSYGG